MKGFFSQPTDDNDDNIVYLIYAGGTFGGHGLPIAPLPADVFLPVLEQLLRTRLAIEHIVVANEIIKDSSTLDSSDFVHFYQLIKQAYNHGGRRFVLITGTDTLSFVAAFLANAFACMDICLVITGSMQPLLVTDDPTYRINEQSDAWHNLSESIEICRANSGVMVQFHHKTFWAHNTQKLDSKKADAFWGIETSIPKQPDCLIAQKDTPNNKHRIIISSVFVLPNHAEYLTHQLSCLHPDTKAVILVAFGSGNFVHSDTVVHALEHLHSRNIPVVCTSMCAFGGVSSVYQAGSWQYQHHVWSGGELTVAAIYGKLLWLYLNDALTLENWVK